MNSLLKGDKVWIPYIHFDAPDFPIDLDNSFPSLIQLGVYSSPRKAKGTVKKLMGKTIVWHRMSIIRDEVGPDVDSTKRDYIEAALEDGGVLGKEGIRLIYACIISVILNEKFMGTPDFIRKVAWIASLGMMVKDE